METSPAHTLEPVLQNRLRPSLDGERTIVMNKVITGTEITIVEIRPQISKLIISDIENEHHHIENYWWVSLSDLMHCLRSITINGRDLGRKFDLNLSNEVFERYGLLCGQEEGQALLTWIGPRSYAVDSLDKPSGDSRYAVFVPLGFSNSILDLATRGIVSVVARRGEDSGITSGGKSIAFYNLVAIDYDDKEYPLLQKGKHGPYALMQCV